MKSSPLQICDATIQPGEIVSMALPTPELYSCTPMYIPIHVVHGKSAGPCLLICAAIHGDEINGVEIIRRLLHLSLLKKIHGTLIAVPVVNVHGLINRSRLLPDGRDLNASFPGSKIGSHAARLAYTFTSEILSKATHCIDIHSGKVNRVSLPQIYVNYRYIELQNLAKVFPTPVILDFPNPDPGSLLETSQNNNILTLVYEAGEALRFDEFAIRIGLRGILQLCREIGMLPKLKHKPMKFKEPIVSQVWEWIRAPTGGINKTLIRLGGKVEKGDKLAVISDPFGSKQEYQVNAESAGVIIGRNNLPLINEGEPLLKVAKIAGKSSVRSEVY
ncbi:MAG: hypothetical protein AMJ43_02010 [Coxiella sp. DG_40]|nr:MAG: hypothetical protein AMJ43_02010 [Coxiella sp. DG_40]